MMMAEHHDLSDSGRDSPSSPNSSPTPIFTDDPIVTIHPLESREGVLVTVKPPEKPSNAILGHVPCDIVLVIDVSFSMNDDAPAAVYDEQGNAAKEHFGLTVLDLTKHAARTVVSTLNEGDRLGIVTFGYSARVVQELIPMTEDNKTLVNTRIDSMEADGATNLWEGIMEGLKLFKSGASGGRVPALMVLTDGQPNHMCPPQGYVRKLRSMDTLPASINTFGFGYGIKSGLLKSIAEVCQGNYAFIPDAGMIGTVFVHAVAHLISTYATRCVLEITTPKSVLLQTPVAKSLANQQCAEDGGEEEDYSRKLTIHLDNLQYGQSRDIYLESVDGAGSKCAYEVCGEDRMIHATLTYSRMGAAEYVAFADEDMLEFSLLPPSVVAYHKSRSMLCDLLGSFSLMWNGEYKDQHLDIVQIENEQRRLREVIDTILAKDYKDKYNKSLMLDLTGQVSEALSRESYFNRWGRHFFFSLRNAHEKQLCNSFKDPGPLMYNDNPLFNSYRDKLDAAFSRIPPPKPSGKVQDNSNHNSSPARPKKAGFNGPLHFTMAKFHSRGNPCFAATSPVLLASGEEVPVCDLREGMLVQTPLGARRVRALLETRASCEAVLCRVGNLLVTPWHPVKINRSEAETRGCEGAEWVFPADVATSTEVYAGAVYSVLLEPDANVDAHAICVGGVWGVTLGHGVTKSNDARAHEFLGDYNAVMREMMMTLGSGEDGVYCSAGVRRNDYTGKVCGFACPQPIQVDEMGSMDRVGVRGRVEICT